LRPPVATDINNRANADQRDFPTRVGRDAKRLACRYWTWSPALLAVAYLAFLAAQLGNVIGATYLNADAASAPVIGSLAGHGSGQIVLGDLPWYSTLLFEFATRHLPLHRQVWEAAPYAMALASVALIAGSLWRVASRWAAALAASLLVCASPLLLLILFSLNDHSPTWFSIALLGAWLVLLEGYRPRSRVNVVALATLGCFVAFIVGINVASDELLIAGGLVPVAGAATLTAISVPTRATRIAAAGVAATVIVAVIVAILTTRIAHDQRVVYSGHNMLGDPARVQANLGLWWQSLIYIGNGNFFGDGLNFTGFLAVACAGVILAAVVGALRVSWLERKPRLSPRNAPARTAYVAFWAAAGLLLTAAYITSSSPVDLFSSRYLVGILYALAALVPLLAERGTRVRAMVVIGALVYCFGGMLAMARGTATENPSNFPNANVASQILTLARKNHLTRGYAGYWDAATMTWETHLAMHVFPVYSCPQSLCAFYLHTIAGWYRPHPHTHTFLLTDSSQPFLASLPPALGRPVAGYPVGPVTMYVFDYDIATRIAP
jgi:hypothetical protein